MKRVYYMELHKAVLKVETTETIIYNTLYYKVQEAKK